MSGGKVINRKGSRTNTLRVSRPRKRVRPTNQHEIEDETASISASAKKLKTSDLQNIPIVATQGYRIINFVMVFSALSNMVKCKICNGNIDFAEASARGLGFKLVINCENCDPRYISSCPLIEKAYEINRRFVFTMRLLGVGYEGIRKFCGFMDMPRIFSKPIYNKIVKNIRISSEKVFSLLISKAAAEEKRLTSRAENTSEIAGLTVSGDGTWRKRGFSSKYGVTTVIGHYSGKVLDVCVKSLCCKMCEYWKSKKNTTEFEEWMVSHKEECSKNHEGSSGKMEVNGIVEIFKRSENLYGVKYLF